MKWPTTNTPALSYSSTLRNRAILVYTTWLQSQGSLATVPNPQLLLPSKTTYKPNLKEKYPHHGHEVPL